jgi:hypothetical protein
MFHLKKMSLIFFIACLGSSASAYVFTSELLTHPTTKKKVLLLGDHHKLGSQEQNFRQLSLFHEKIVEKIAEKKLTAQILHEGVGYYSAPFMQHRINGSDNLMVSFFPLIKNISPDGLDVDMAFAEISSDPNNGTTWITRDLRMFYQGRPVTDSIELKACDTRFPLLVSDYISAELFEEKDLVHYLKLLGSTSLLKYRYYKDHLSSKALEIFQTLERDRNRETLEARFSNISTLTEWDEFLSNDEMDSYFSTMLDQDIFIDIVRENSPEISVVIVGNDHLYNIRWALTSYGYTDSTIIFGTSDYKKITEKVEFSEEERFVADFLDLLAKFDYTSLNLALLVSKYNRTYDSLDSLTLSEDLESRLEETFNLFP